MINNPNAALFLLTIIIYLFHKFIITTCIIKSPWFSIDRDNLLLSGGKILNITEHTSLSFKDHYKNKICCKHIEIT